jgi:hypothetical protein
VAACQGLPWCPPRAAADGAGYPRGCQATRGWPGPARPCQSQLAHDMTTPHHTTRGSGSCERRGIPPSLGRPRKQARQLPVDVPGELGAVLVAARPLHRRPRTHPRADRPCAPGGALTLRALQAATPGVGRRQGRAGQTHGLAPAATRRVRLGGQGLEGYLPTYLAGLGLVLGWGWRGRWGTGGRLWLPLLLPPTTLTIGSGLRWARHVSTERHCFQCAWR